MARNPANGSHTPASAALRARLGTPSPKVLLTLGSGLGDLVEEMTVTAAIDFADIGLPAASVRGHAGRLVSGELDGVGILVQQGRLHLYEGHAPADVTAVVDAAADSGVDTLVVTNAAGGLAPGLRPGDLLVLSDHLNLTATSPLVGRAPAFLDLRDAYDPALRAAAHAAAAQLGETLAEGVYAGVVGPAYETPAEVRMLRTLGADAVGMSTVLEVIAARARGLRVLGVSMITNVHGAAEPVHHDDVLEVAAASGGRLTAVLRALLPRLASP